MPNCPLAVRLFSWIAGVTGGMGLWNSPCFLHSSYGGGPAASRRARWWSVASDRGFAGMRRFPPGAGRVVSPVRGVCGVRCVRTPPLW